MAQELMVKDEGQDGPPPTTQLTVKDAAEDGTMLLLQPTVKDEGQDGPQQTTQLVVQEWGPLGPAVCLGHPCGAAGDREGPAALSCRVRFVFLFPISFRSIGEVLVWSVGRDSQVPGPDRTGRAV